MAALELSEGEPILTDATGAFVGIEPLGVDDLDWLYHIHPPTNITRITTTVQIFVLFDIFL
jgi:hypothetical protein